MLSGWPEVTQQWSKQAPQDVGQKVKGLWVQHRGQASPRPVSRQAGTTAPGHPPCCLCCSTLTAHSHLLSFLLLLFLGDWLSRVCV